MTARTAFIFISLVIFAVILTTARVAVASHHRMLPVESETLASLIQQLLIAMWVYFDRRDRRLELPYEFEAYVFFAWPIALPYYLVKSRGSSRDLAVCGILSALRSSFGGRSVGSGSAIRVES